MTSTNESTTELLLELQYMVERLKGYASCLWSIDAWGKSGELLKEAKKLEEIIGKLKDICK